MYNLLYRFFYVVNQSQIILRGYAILNCQHLDNPMILIFRSASYNEVLWYRERVKEENSMQKKRYFMVSVYIYQSHTME